MLAEHGLYVDSLIYEIEYQDIKFDENYRKQLEEKADKEGLENLYNMAKKIDENQIIMIEIEYNDNSYKITISKGKGNINEF